MLIKLALATMAISLAVACGGIQSAVGPDMFGSTLIVWPTPLCRSIRPQGANWTPMCMTLGCVGS